MKLTCIVIDDERHAAELLATYIRQTPGLELSAVYTNPLLALESFNERAVDISFLDIDMPELSGLELAGLIGRRTSVVFTTSYRDYAPEAFEQEAADYLLKPVGYERFLRSVQKIREGSNKVQPAAQASEHFFIKSDLKGKMLRVDTADIRYIESAGNYVWLCLGKEKVAAYLTLGELLEQLPAGQFYRIHKSFIVAHRYIRSLEHGQVRLRDVETPLPVGRAYSEDFLRRMQGHLIISKRDR